MSIVSVEVVDALPAASVATAVTTARTLARRRHHAAQRPVPFTTTAGLTVSVELISAAADLDAAAASAALMMLLPPSTP